MWGIVWWDYSTFPAPHVVVVSRCMPGSTNESKRQSDRCEEHGYERFAFQHCYSLVVLISISQLHLFLKSNPVGTTEKINVSIVSKTYVCHVFCSLVGVLSTVHKKQMNGIDVWQYYFCLVLLSCMLPWTKAVRLFGCYAQFCCSFK